MKLYMKDLVRTVNEKGVKFAMTVALQEPVFITKKTDKCHEVSVREFSKMLIKKQRNVNLDTLEIYPDSKLVIDWDTEHIPQPKIVVVVEDPIPEPEAVEMQEEPAEEEIIAEPDVVVTIDTSFEATDGICPNCENEHRDGEAYTTKYGYDKHMKMCMDPEDE